MPKEEPHLLTYEFEFSGNIFNSYYFDTPNGIYYEIKFKPSAYLFEGYPAFAYNTFEFAIVVLDNQTGKNPSFDPLVSNTIAKIVFDFFQNHERIILYTCDTSDGRGEARQRRFNLWFDYYKGVNYWKLDTTFEDPSGDNLLYFIDF